MTRTKYSKNNTRVSAPATLSLSTEERIEFIANLIVDRLEEEYAQKSQAEDGTERENA